MLLTRWTPFFTNESGRLHEEMDRLYRAFDDVRSRWPAFAFSYPPLNVWEDEDNVYAEAESPGMSQDDLEVFVSEGNLLTVKGERRSCEEKGVWHRQERGAGQFSRTIPLPAPVEADKVEARLENGVLLVTLPKSEIARPRRIAIKAE